MTRRRPPFDPTLRAGRLALLTTSAVTLGFQSIVTSVVYPQLFDGATHGIAERQSDHARRIAPVALTLYATSLGAAVWAVYGSLREQSGRAGRHRRRGAAAREHRPGADHPTADRGTDGIRPAAHRDRRRRSGGRRAIAQRLTGPASTERLTHRSSLTPRWQCRTGDEMSP